MRHTSVTALMLAFREPEKPPMSLDFARWVLAVCEARRVVDPETYALAQRAQDVVSKARRSA